MPQGSIVNPTTRIALPSSRQVWAGCQVVADPAPPRDAANRLLEEDRRADLRVR